MKKTFLSSLLFINILLTPLVLNVVFSLMDFENEMEMSFDLEEEEEKGGEENDGSEEDERVFAFDNELCFSELKTQALRIRKSCFLKSLFHFDIPTPPPELS